MKKIKLNTTHPKSLHFGLYIYKFAIEKKRAKSTYTSPRHSKQKPIICYLSEKKTYSLPQLAK